MGSWAQLPGAQKWLITLSGLMVTIMQIPDISVTSAVLPHMPGALAAGLEEVTWVLTSLPCSQCHHPARHRMARGLHRPPSLLPRPARCARRRRLVRTGRATALGSRVNSGA